ncbi:MAG: sulfatase-like hydrolase/transferase, partial [Planctomycetaceae bacterium]|nr:sulfatase-like hydrolase/transferase [Planctomycetaceae bacterium]
MTILTISLFDRYSRYFAVKILLLINIILINTTCCRIIAADETNVDKPNVILILADDLGYGDIKIFSPDCKIATPHLDRLGHEGIRFTDMHSSSSVCTPTRYSILTGRYNWRSRKKSGV